MKYSFAPSLDKRERADLLVIPFWEGPSEAAELGSLKESLRAALASGDYKGKSGEGALVYVEGEKEERLLLLGLGRVEKATPESIRRAYSNAVKTAHSKKAKSLNLLFPRSRALGREEMLRGVCEGILLANYAFTHLKGDSLKENPVILLEKVGWIGLDRKDDEFLQKIQTIVGGVYFARELVNGNADFVTPRMLAETAQSLEKLSPKLKASIYDKKWLQQQKMGLILAVSRASTLDPYLIQLSYKGNARSKEHIVLVGKGVTYDTGGLSLKTPDGMVLMKSDMAAAAAVLGAVQTAAALNLKVNVTALVPSVENAIGPASYKLGDVYRSYSGKTIEVNNTDAEGRLILADALSYAVQNLKPTHLIDLATLTGNIILALGEEMSGLFTVDEEIAGDLSAASASTAELLWRMPIHHDYRDSLKSDIADLINTGGREAGAIKAALFLQEFVGSVPWAHLDIAGPTYWLRPRYYHPTKATGYGVRLLVEFLERREAK